MKVHKTAAIPISALGLVLAIAIFATATHAFSLTSGSSTSTTTTATHSSSATTSSCVDNIEQQGDYSGEFGCQTGSDSGPNDSSTEAAGSEV